MRYSVLVVTCAVVIVLAGPARAQAESLAVARELYASAAYDEALLILNRLVVGTYAREDRRAIALYRALCLMAVGRKAEADRAIEAMIAHDPLYRAAGEDVPPRMRAAVSDARKRLLPAIIQQKYIEAKAEFDRQNYEAAVRGFDETLTALADPDVAHVAAQSPLSDLRTLALGFQDLSAKALTPPPQVVSAPVEVAAFAPPPPALAQEPRLYGPQDWNVVPPSTLRQELPPFPGRIATPMTGVVEVIIDAGGAVESATIRERTHPQYDKLVVSAARNWQYQPATVNGLPVRYRKLVQINLVAAR